jgi:hypothetical protein
MRLGRRLRWLALCAAALHTAQAAEAPHRRVTGAIGGRRWREGDTAMSADLDRYLLVYGPASEDLWVSATSADADLQVTRTDLRPDGQEMFVHAFRRDSRLRLWVDAPSAWGGYTFDYYATPARVTLWRDPAHRALLRIGVLDDVLVPESPPSCGEALGQPCRADPLAGAR